MGTKREHADDLRDWRRWEQVFVGDPDDGGVILVKCPWCRGLLVAADAEAWGHAQWHVFHMDTHGHDETRQGNHLGEFGT